MIKQNKTFKICIIIGLFLLFFCVGSLQLNKLPNTLNQDEMGFSLGAKQLADTGYDLCGNKLPLFVCFSKEMPYYGFTVSYYSTALFYKLYSPHNIFDIRIFSILIGAITGVFFFFFTNELLQKNKNKLFYSIVFSIIFYFSVSVFTLQRFGAPYFILPILLQLILFYLIYDFWISKKREKIFFILIIATLLLFDYQVYRFFAPFYLILFVWLFRKEIFTKPDSQKNNLGLLPKIKSVLFKNKYILLGSAIFATVFLLVLQQTMADRFTTEYYFTEKHFSLLKLLLDYLFFFSPFPFYFYYNFLHPYNYGLFPALSAIFFIFGLIWIFKNFKQNNFFKFILIAFLSYPIPSALLGVERFSSNRIVNLIPIYFIISAYGICTFQALANLVKKNPLNLKKIPPLLLTPIFWLIVIAFQNFYFIYDYFYKIPYQSSCQPTNGSIQNCGFAGLFYYLKNETKNYDKIYLDENLLFISAYAEFFNKTMNYNIKNYKVVNIANSTIFEKNSLMVISNKKAQALEMEKKYKLIDKIPDPNTANSFYYVFASNNQ